MLGNRDLHVFAVSRPQRRPFERVALGSGNQGVPVQSWKRSDSGMPHVGIDEDHQEAAVVQELAQLQLPQLKQFAQTEVKRSRFASADRSAVGCSRVECARCDTFDLLRNGLHVQDARVVVENRRRVGNRVVVDVGTGNRTAERDDSHWLPPRRLRGPPAHCPTCSPEFTLTGVKRR